MANKKNSDHFKFVKAIVSGGGDLHWTYKLNGAAVTGRQTHDEDVSDFSEKDIENLTRSMLSIEPDDPVNIEIVYQ